MSNAVLTVVLGLVALSGFALKKAIELILEREYDDWSRGLARLTVKVAGRVHKPKKEEWWADLCFLQAEGRSGLVPALRCLSSAPGLSFHAAALENPAVRRLLVSDEPERLVGREAETETAEE
jgi:hypothetical protein